MRPGLYAFAAAASFLGATTHIGLVEQPAWLALSGAAMLREWKRSNRRGTPVLSVFAVVSSVLAYVQFKTDGDVRWLIGGTIILASWPYAYFVMMPVNVWLFMIPPGTALSGLRKLTRDRGLMELGHVPIGFAAACVFAWALELPL
jgi:Domain of unknown function (DUF1772)